MYVYSLILVLAPKIQHKWGPAYNGVADSALSRLCTHCSCTVVYYSSVLSDYPSFLSVLLLSLCRVSATLHSTSISMV